MSTTDTLRQDLDRLQLRSLIAGGAGAALLVAGMFVSSEQFFRSYLYGYLLWLGLTLGCLGLLLLHHLVSGHWGNVIQRMLEAGARGMVLMAMLFLPILTGLQSLYPWTDHQLVESSHVLHQKAGYLSIPFFIGRAALYFLFWGGVAFFLVRWSRAQDATGDPGITRRLKIFSGPSLVFFVLTVTLASVDWMMSLEPEWYSTIYGMSMIVGAVLTTLAFCILLVSRLADRPPIADVLTTRHIHHLGNLLMAFTVLWAYMAFSQFLIIWSGNLPEDNFWYLKRLGTGWNVIAIILLIGHFFVPFLLLLSRRTKRAINNLSKIAVGVLVMRLVDLFWLIMPAFQGAELQLHWLDLVAPIGIGGLWMAYFFSQLKGAPLLPLHDPRFSGETSAH
jgi:hypothetical protein